MIVNSAPVKKWEDWKNKMKLFEPKKKTEPKEYESP
jgi:hypothetical protein